MATKSARVKSILTAVLDAEPTVTQSSRILDGFALTYAPDMAATMTAAEKAALLLHVVRAWIRDTVHSVEVQQAQEQARQSIIPPDLGAD
jgi:phage tail protein X